MKATFDFKPRRRDDLANLIGLSWIGLDGEVQVEEEELALRDAQPRC
jgi:hypothetical protein